MKMPSLLELQSAFARGVLDPADAAVLAHLCGARGMDAAAGLAVYRNNTFSNYRAALREAYPVIRRLVGDGFFDQAADDYVRITPSHFGDINLYGDAFGAFLSGYPGARELAYLPDVARLEWACHRAFGADDAAPLDIARLAAVPEERLDELRFTLHPSAALVDSPWPILAIWRANQPHFDGEPSVDLTAGGARLLVLRRGHDVDLEPLAAAERAMLAALAAGARLGAALDSALALDAGFDLNDFLRRHVQARTLVDFRLPHALSREREGGQERLRCNA
jgi:hypothetical protein